MRKDTTSESAGVSEKLSYEAEAECIAREFWPEKRTFDILALIDKVRQEQAAAYARLVTASQNLLDRWMWESNMDRQVETDYEKAVVELRDALAALGRK